MLLNEIVKNFLSEPKVDTNVSSVVDPDNTLLDMSSDNYNIGTSFFDDDINGGIFGSNEASSIAFKQAEKIKKYRQMSMHTDVCEAIDEIVNEIVFVYDDKQPLKLDINEENKKLSEAINKSFDKIIKLSNLKKNFYQIVKQTYVDGQICMHLQYDDKTTKNGIKSIKLIDPCMFVFDSQTNTYKYIVDNKSVSHAIEQKLITYDIEEIVKEDFGLFDENICLSYLEYALKPANMLKTLEDLLIPLRFSRSISRRVFNVDIGDLPSKRGAEVMRDYQNKFKYKKFYDNSTGEVTNQRHITSMVEDYWFSNRSGGKGTQVDVLDESGNLGELDDILYFAKKLYRSLKIPSSRMSINPDADNEFDYDSTRVTKEDMKFFMFISRIRQIYSNVFKEILKREVISTGVMKESEWNSKEDNIEVNFINENSFIEKMKLDNFMSKLDIYSTTQEYQGKLFSVNKILKDVFKFTDEEIKENFEEIQKEEKNKLYSKFYEKDEEGKW